MILTEGDAGKKICVQNQDVRCIASACMAWRVAGFYSNGSPAYLNKLDSPNWTHTTADLINKAEAMYKSPVEPVGYCGLAGKP